MATTFSLALQIVALATLTVACGCEETVEVRRDRGGRVAAPSSSSTRAQSASLHLRRMRNAIGRRDDVRTLIATGTFMHRNRDCPYWIRIKIPDSFQLIELETSLGRNAPGGTPKIATLRNGNGWLYGTRGRLSAPYVDGLSKVMPNPEAVARRDIAATLLGIVPELLVNSKVITVSDVEGSTESLELAVRDELGEFGRLFLDSDTHLPKRFEYRWISVVPAGAEYRQVYHYEDYRSTDAGLLPHRIARTTNEEGGSALILSSYSVGGELSDHLFRRPTPETLRGMLPTTSRGRY